MAIFSLELFKGWCSLSLITAVGSGLACVVAVAYIRPNKLNDCSSSPPAK